MNNSMFGLQELKREDVSLERLTERESYLLKVIEAIQSVENSKEWQLLKKELFDSLCENIQKQLLYEARREIPDINKITRLAGELKWAERYSNLRKLADSFKVELSGLKNKIAYAKGKTTKNTD